MQLCLLQLDDALETQAAFLRACDADRAHRVQIDGSGIRLWGHHTDIAAFREKAGRAIGSNREPRLTFMGSGDFHHVSAVLLASALEHCSEPVTLVHVDNHPDWVTFKKGSHCGSWLNCALENAQVQKVITLGVCSNDLESPEPKLANLPLLSRGALELYPYDCEKSQISGNYGAGACFDQVEDHLHWKTMRAIGEQNFVEYLLSRIETEAVYLSLDKDVLSREFAVTNWDQGAMQLPYLLSLIDEIGRKHRVIGADVIGDYSKPAYSGSPRSMLSKYYERFKDQPRGRPDPQNAADINSATNLALLHAFSQVML